MTLELPRPDQIAQLVYLSVFGVLLAASLARSRRMGLGAALRAIILWIGLMAVALMAYAYRDDLKSVGYRVLGALIPGMAVPGSTPGSVVVSKSRDGHFHVRASVHGQMVQMIVDTGASSVVLTDRDAAAIGLRPRSGAYTVETSTANGAAATAPVVLTDLAIGDIVLKNVPALVAQPGALDNSLLGNSFLDQLASFTVSGDRLTMTR